MYNTVSATKNWVNFGETLRRVENYETTTVEHAGDPKAVILSIKEWKRLKQADVQAETWKDRLERTQQRFLRDQASGRADRSRIEPARSE